MIAVPMADLFRLGDGLWHGVIVFLRVSALVSVLPAFGERNVPLRVKLVAAIMFTAIVAPAVPVGAPPADLPTIARFSLTESAVGLALGLGLRLFVLALQTAGAMAAQSTSLSQILGGATGEPTPAFGYVLVIAGLALAVMAGLHVRAAEFLIRSYDLLPAGQFPDGRILSSWGLGLVSRAFALAFALAAPFVIASVLYNVTLGVINRAMPQLMVAFVGAPAIAFGGLFLLALSAPVILSTWSGHLTGFLNGGIGAAP